MPGLQADGTVSLDAEAQQGAVKLLKCKGTWIFLPRTSALVSGKWR